jgi:hypothetical protein
MGRLGRAFERERKTPEIIAVRQNVLPNRAWLTSRIDAQRDVNDSTPCSRRRQFERHARELAQRIVQLASRLPDDRDMRNPRSEGAQHHFGFETRQHLANAHMDAGAEGDVARRTARNIECLGPVSFAAALRRRLALRAHDVNSPRRDRYRKERPGQRLHISRPMGYERS